MFPVWTQTNLWTSSSRTAATRRLTNSERKKDQFNHHMDALLCSAQFAVSFVQQGTQADAIFWGSGDGFTVNPVSVCAAL